MKCSACGAELKDGAKFCEYCGSQITYADRKEQEQLNKKGCPKCNSSNITFSREKQGEIRNKKGTAAIRETVGLCKDCGYTWSQRKIDNKSKSVVDNKLLWWVLGWIFFFPIPVMILVWRKKNTWSTKTKVIVTAAFWILVFVIGALNPSKEEQLNSTSTEIVSYSESKEETDVKVEENAKTDVENEMVEAVKEEKKDESKAEETNENSEEIKFSVKDIIALITPSLDNAFGKNYNIDGDETGISIEVWQDGITSGAMYAASGDKDNLAAWEEMKNSIGLFAGTTYDTVKQLTSNENINVTVNVLNDTNKDNVLLMYINGVCVYDCLE